MTDVAKIQKLFTDRDYKSCLAKIPAKTTNADLLRIKGYCLQKDYKWEEAMEAWNQLIARDDTVSEYYAERAVCKFHLGFKSTMEDLNIAVELESDNPYRYACRAFITDKLGDTGAAIEDYRRALEIEPDNEVTLNNLGLLEEKQGYAGMAKDRFKQADVLANLSKEFQFGETETQPEMEMENPSSTWKEIQKMLSSGKEFKKFLREASSLFRRKKN